MDPVVGAIIAALVAWVSIVIAVRIPLPQRFHSPRGVRRLGGLTIALFALQVLGTPLPFWVPLAFFALGLGVLLLLHSLSRDAAAGQVP